MANLSNTEALTLPIDRQDLYNMFANATLGTIGADEVVDGLFAFDVGTDITAATSSPEPGHLFYAKNERVMYCYHDEVDDTGVSLWLAIGPDRFDIAMLADSPVPAGAVVQYKYDRWVGVSTGASAHIANQRAIGTCAAGMGGDWFTNGVSYDLTTQASGTWIPVSIDGIVWCVTVGNMAVDRWVRVSDGTPGTVVRASNAVPQPTDGDDVLGLCINTVAGSAATPVGDRFHWTGPRVVNAL